MDAKLYGRFFATSDDMLWYVEGDAITGFVKVYSTKISLNFFQELDVGKGTGGGTGGGIACSYFAPSVSITGDAKVLVVGTECTNLSRIVRIFSRNHVDDLFVEVQRLNGELEGFGFNVCISKNGNILVVTAPNASGQSGNVDHIYIYIHVEAINLLN